MSERLSKVGQARIPETITLSTKQLRGFGFIILNVAGLLINGGYTANSLIESHKNSKAVTIEQLDDRVSKLEKQGDENSKKLDAQNNTLERILKLLSPRRKSIEK